MNNKYLKLFLYTCAKFSPRRYILIRHTRCCPYCSPRRRRHRRCRLHLRTDNQNPPATGTDGTDTFTNSRKCITTRAQGIKLIIHFDREKSPSFFFY